MSARLLRAATLLAAAVCLHPSAAVAQEPPRSEVDIIFPLNQTYTTSDIFPIVLAIQNLTVIRSLGNFTFWWGIMRYSEGRFPSGSTSDQGYFNLDDLQEEDETYIAVANSNVTDFIYRKTRGEKYSLQWSIRWPDLDARCFDGDHHLYRDVNAWGDLLFSIEAPWEIEANERGLGSPWEEAGLGVVPDIMAVPECPVLGSVVEIKPNVEAPLCPIVDDDNGVKEGNSCAIKVDKAVASSIASRASTLATPPVTVTPTPSSSAYDDDENAARGFSPPVLAAVAAACALGYLSVLS